MSSAVLPSPRAVQPESSWGRVEARIELTGVDVCVRGDFRADDLAADLLPLAGDLRLETISNQGRSVWPTGDSELVMAGHWRCRFLPLVGGPTSSARIEALLDRLAGAGIEPIGAEGLYTLDGVPVPGRGGRQ